jgi:hypothetical protein
MKFTSSALTHIDYINDINNEIDKGTNFEGAYLDVRNKRFLETPFFNCNANNEYLEFFSFIYSLKISVLDLSNTYIDENILYYFCDLLVQPQFKYLIITNTLISNFECYRELISNFECYRELSSCMFNTRNLTKNEVIDYIDNKLIWIKEEHYNSFKVHDAIYLTHKNYYNRLNDGTIG